MVNNRIFILEWTIYLLWKTNSQAFDSWICHVCWNVAGTVSQMRQRLCHRGPAVPKSITPTMERCSGNAQCPTMDTNCWLTWKLSSTLIYNLTSEVLQWPLCVHMTTGQREKIWASTIVVVLVCMHAHQAIIENILLMNIKKQLHKCGSVTKDFFCMSQVYSSTSNFGSETFVKVTETPFVCGNRYSSEGEGWPCLDFPFCHKGLVKADSLLTCLFDDQHSRMSLLILLNHRCSAYPEWKYQKLNEMF